MEILNNFQSKIQLKLYKKKRDIVFWDNIPSFVLFGQISFLPYP